MYSRSMVEVKATYTMPQMPIYKGIEGCHGIWLHVFGKSLRASEKYS